MCGEDNTLYVGAAKVGVVEPIYVFQQEAPAVASSSHGTGTRDQEIDRICLRLLDYTYSIWQLIKFRQTLVGAIGYMLLERFRNITQYSVILTKL